MADDTQPPTDDEPKGDEFKPITTQDDLNRIIGERVARERQKFADYADLKTKAKRFDDLDASSKSETEKLRDQISALSTALESERKSVTRARIQAKHGISDEDAALFLTGDDEATLTRQAQALAAKVVDRKKSGNHVPTEGKTPAPASASALRDFTRGLFGGD